MAQIWRRPPDRNIWILAEVVSNVTVDLRKWATEEPHLCLRGGLGWAWMRRRGRVGCLGCINLFRAPRKEQIESLNRASLIWSREVEQLSLHHRRNIRENRNCVKVMLPDCDVA